jgi:multidrug resistance efflux pump
MKHRNLILAIVLALAAGSVGGWWWLSQADAAAETLPLEATGVIEARQVAIAPEIGGKVVAVLVEASQPVTAGQPLVRLDDSLLIVQRAQAAAVLRTAQANLALLKAGASADQIQAAEAQLAGAQANVRLAQAALDGATVGIRPEDIAAMSAHLDLARAGYEGLTVVLAADQIEKARSALATAETNLSEATARRDDLAADTRNPASVIAAAQAAIADAQAAVAAAQSAYDAARSAGDALQPYHRQIELARLSWEVAQANSAQAQARLEGLKSDSRTTPEALDAAEATLGDAQAQAEAAQAAYDALAAGSSAPRLAAAWAEVQRAQSHLAAFGLGGAPAGGVVSPSGTPPEGEAGAPSGMPPEGEAGLSSAAPSSVETLLTQIDAATALRDVAAANLATLKSGARSEQVDAAQAQVDAAQAQLSALDLQLNKLTLSAPWDGVVLDRSVESGQTAPPGGSLLQIGRLDSLELTVYLPEERFGLVTPGQAVTVNVDAYPGRTFVGKVLRVADEAEFTPTNVQTKQDRSRLVYAVVIGLDNPDRALKPGMIADVEFGP